LVRARAGLDYSAFIIMKKTKKTVNKPMALCPRGSIIPFWQGSVHRENIPKSLKRAGIQGISDNLKPGQEVRVSGHLIFDF